MEKYFEIAAPAIIHVFDENLMLVRDAQFTNEVKGLQEITKNPIKIGLHRVNELKNSYFEILDELPMSALRSACDNLKPKAWR